ncbi:importin 13 [Ophiostoma piceae UAMH 11346]|uniref:Importin 13 n=1 Tax=Ophiostoma piceae (strain UAMH 11346) TaxID=1262450 RepID=S3C9K3_OPHP1|nr:importin 13 [Ophiostoma piceae UAMH 11346]
MPFIPNTPESLVGRSDSKNPATTCRGITSGGRPCRRPIPAGDANQPSLSTGGAPHSAANGRSKRYGLRADDPRDERLYCWQHKDQAAMMSARSSPGPQASRPAVSPSNIIMEERTSFDTLADRLNLLSVNSGRKRTNQGPAEWSKPRPKPSTKPKQTTSFFCCFSIPIEDKEEMPSAPVRPRPRPFQPARPTTASPGRSTYNNEKLTVAAAAHSRPSSRHSHSHYQRPSSNSNSRRPSAASYSSQTAHYLSLILPSTSPNTASALMAELAKPISQGDEAGYIYMFWVTPGSSSQSAGTKPPAEAARALLSPPRPSGQRRPSDVVASFAEQQTKSRKGGARKTLLLKIGRANNVHRRLNEWTRQCGDDLTLIRYYPYVASGSSPGASPMRDEPRKIPHSHKVERLVHLELAGAGLRAKPGSEKCGCGREHREWFEVDATRAAVAAVDEVIRRWSDWDEGLQG